MTTTQPDSLAAVPDPAPRVAIDPHHLSITQTWESGGSHNVHLLQNSDLRVILQRGQDDAAVVNHVPHNLDDTGLVVVSLGVDDGDHDEVHYTDGEVIAEEVLGQALEAIAVCRDALRRARMT